MGLPVFCKLGSTAKCRTGRTAVSELTLIVVLMLLQYSNSGRAISCPHTTQQQPFYGHLSGTTRVSRYQKEHSPTHRPDHPVFICFFHLPWSGASSLFKLHACLLLGSLFAYALSMSSLIYLLVWSPPPHIPYISLPNQCLLFATHAHTIATCFAVVSILYHLCLAYLSTRYLELYLLP